ncbi:MAG: TadE/TadG family type IV pilus assembly protein [Brevundimonas sp.]
MARATSQSRKTFTRRKRSWLRNRDGSAAIEFALIALPFFLMMFALLELGMVFVVDSVLANATFETGRLVRTGQAGAAGMTREQFKTDLCSRMSVFSADCEDRLSVDVRVIPAFNEPLPDPMQDGETFNEGALDFNYGVAGSLVVVRVWYRQPLITTYLSKGLSRLGDGSARLMSTTAFRNEPA